MIKGALEDSFERLVEEGSTAVKKTVKSGAKQLVSAVSPSKMWEQLLGVTSNSSPSAVKERTGARAEVKHGGQHTPLEFQKLAQKYEQSDKQKTDMLRQRLFQLVKQGEEKVFYDKKKELEEKKKEEYYKTIEKKREADKKKQNEAGDIPKGKVRRSIFSPKKVAERSHAETKPSTGKQ